MNKREFLQREQAARLTEEVKRERQPLVANRCAWCALIARGILNVVPRPSLEQCAPHAALNREWTVSMGALKEGVGLEDLRADILRRGIAITRPVTNSGAA